MTPGRSTHPLRTKIRIARVADVPGLLACLDAAFLPFRGAYTPRAYTATVLSESTARRRLRSMTVLIAEDRRHRIVGTVSIQRASPRHAHLRGMAVVPALQGSGVATALVDQAIERAGDLGFERITLETTRPLRRAARFYRRHGFRRTGRTRLWSGMTLIEFELRLVPRGEGPGQTA